MDEERFIDEEQEEIEQENIEREPEPSVFAPVTLENLNDKGVEIRIQKTETDTVFRAALPNSIAGRKELVEILSEYPLEIQKVMDVWGNQPTVDESEMESDFPPLEFGGEDGYFYLMNPDMTLPLMVSYLSEVEITEEDVWNNKQNLCSVYTIPVLLKMIQDLQDRVAELES